MFCALPSCIHCTDYPWSLLQCALRVDWVMSHSCANQVHQTHNSNSKSCFYNIFPVHGRLLIKPLTLFSSRIELLPIPLGLLLHVRSLLAASSSTSASTHMSSSPTRLLSISLGWLLVVFVGLILLWRWWLSVRLVWTATIGIALMRGGYIAAVGVAVCLLIARRSCAICCWSDLRSAAMLLAMLESAWLNWWNVAALCQLALPNFWRLS